VTASGVKIEAYWPKLFAKALHGKDIASFFNFGSSAPSAPVAATTTATVAPPAEKKADDKAGKKK